jgi:tRNA (mo5U34)-methyltransferase
VNSTAPSDTFWWHSIDLGGGVVTPGAKSPAHLAAEWEALRLPELGGKSVLDVGTWDGYFAFEAERSGAASVVALDHYVWALDLPRQQAYWRECQERGVPPEPYHTVPRLWQPDQLPGKRGFDTAHAARQSRVRAVVADFMTMDLTTLGIFDVVFYLGVLYHMEDPLGALRRLAAVTRELAVIETQAIAVPRYEESALCEFYPSHELNADVSNWWAPNARALGGLCRAAGFARVNVLTPPPRRRFRSALYRSLVRPAVVHYVLVAHAWRG